MNIVGYVEFIDISEVRGWAYLPESAADHLEITIALEDFVVGSGKAEIHRDDLQTHGYGGGDHAFTVPLDIPIRPEDLRDLDVFAKSAAGATVRLARTAEAVIVTGNAPTSIGPEPSAAAATDETLDIAVELNPAAPSPRPCGGFANARDADALKVFIVGSPRSGAAVLLAAIRDAFALPIHGVSNIPANFPDAYMILIRCGGIEAVDCARQMFGTDFRSACENWVHVMQGVLRARALPTPILEVDPFDFTSATHKVAHRIGSFLGYPESTDALATILAASREDRHIGPDWSRRLTLNDVRWSNEEKALFTERCGALMTTFGYPLTGDPIDA